MEISPELARVHAHLCGDGSVFIYKTTERNRKFSAGVGYYNNNQRLLDKFRTDFNKLFGVKMKMKNNRAVSIRSIKRYNYFIENFGKFGSRQWRVHDSIKNSSKEIKLEWLKAFFEDEAYNFLGLNDAKELLSSMGIKCNITGPNCDESYYLTIPHFDLVSEFKNFVKEPARK